MLKTILSQLSPIQTKLVAVSKTKPLESILSLYHQGHTVFGENRVQEICTKFEALPKNIEWHFIGHLQSNKVKFIAPFISCIHSVDSLKLLKEINKQGRRHERIIDCLLQFHIAEEESKFGLDLEEARQILESPSYLSMKNVRITGVMGMATFTFEMDQVRREFKELKNIFQQLKKDFFKDSNHFKEISMGMSGDYQIALEEGSTIVRIGSLLFGKR